MKLCPLDLRLNRHSGEKDGMEGIDFAFYKNRAYYHTPFDSIPGMGRSEGRKALWSLMETVRGAGMALLNDEVVGSNTPGVYFDSEFRSLAGISTCSDGCSSGTCHDKLFDASIVHDACRAPYCGPSCRIESPSMGDHVCQPTRA